MFSLLSNVSTLRWSITSIETNCHKKWSLPHNTNQTESIVTNTEHYNTTHGDTVDDDDTIADDKKMEKVFEGITVHIVVMIAGVINVIVIIIWLIVWPCLATHYVPCVNNDILHNVNIVPADHITKSVYFLDQSRTTHPPILL